ncbi:hypothetical protein [Streptomyces sp. NPDC000410]|uniref:hypothetical protein n=1 Tax=Streptomyces sp. NPDC000410 TaxID=3154254 RepID=UPI00332B013A
MADLIRALARWARRRLGTRPTPTATPPLRVHPLPSVQAPPSPTWPPAHRSPYGLDEPPLNGADSPLVRPYLRDHEERARRRERRLALVLAADFGIDLDAHLVGARGAA